MLVQDRNWGLKTEAKSPPTGFQGWDSPPGSGYSLVSSRVSQGVLRLPPAAPPKAGGTRGAGNYRSEKISLRLVLWAGWLAARGRSSLCLIFLSPLAVRVWRDLGGGRIDSGSCFVEATCRRQARRLQILDDIKILDDGEGLLWRPRGCGEIGFSANTGF